MKLNHLSALLILLACCGCSSEEEYPVIEANFELKSDKTLAFVPVQFESVVDGAYAYFWDFGNGTTSNEKTVSPIYEEPGTYTVSLTTTSLNKVKNTVRKEVKIGAYFINKITAIPRNGYSNGDLYFGIQQDKPSGWIAVDQNKIPFELSSSGEPFQISTPKIAFGGNSFDFGLPIIILVDNTTNTEPANSYLQSGLAKMELNEEGTAGKIFLNLRAVAKYDFELEFSYEYVD
ncbi:PKD domain-containing protein [Algoriphagus winogradskyi]|uniref:PKD domain-containing protein n=1 Tax=Algoriphagus winogradskyi TaxID=237017 RepID=A0ABY1NWL3_9BACT|nr:PKD domain-containing protein [Algoriphagus winogradskyi]SMP20206.1 PKD domain-containing protein [Algoriphagus winogradskyi]